MISIIVLWFYICVILLVYGIAAVKILSKLFGFTEKLPPLPLVFVAGLCLVSTLVGYLSLFMRIGFFAHICVLSIAVVFVVSDSELVFGFFARCLCRVQKTNKLIQLLFSISTLIILLYKRMGFGYMDNSPSQVF